MSTTENQIMQSHRRPELESMQFLIDRYKPTNQENADFFFTTREISAIIQEHTGINLPILELSKMLGDLDYQRAITGGTSLVWMLKRADS